MNASPNDFLVRTPPDPPHLKPSFLRFLGRGGGVGGWGGVKNVKKKNPPFFGSKILNLLVFFDFEPRKCFPVPTPWGLYGAE